MSVMYLFTRVRFNWNEVNYSVFSTYSMITNLVGSSTFFISMSFVVLTMFVNDINSRFFFTQFRYDVFGRCVQSHVAN